MKICLIFVSVFVLLNLPKRQSSKYLLVEVEGNGSGYEDRVASWMPPPPPDEIPPYWHDLRLRSKSL